MGTIVAKLLIFHVNLVTRVCINIIFYYFFTVIDGRGAAESSTTASAAMPIKRAASPLAPIGGREHDGKINPP